MPKPIPSREEAIIKRDLAYLQVYVACDERDYKRLISLAMIIKYYQKMIDIQH